MTRRTALSRASVNALAALMWCGLLGYCLYASAGDPLYRFYWARIIFISIVYLMWSASLICRALTLLSIYRAPLHIWYLVALKDKFGAKSPSQPS